MAKPVCSGATLQCSFGASPANLIIINPLRPTIGNMPIGNIMDMTPMVNITSFGMCRSMANPQVASATAAAMGTLTPMPCIPVLVAPWSPGGKPKIANFPILTDSCKLVCAWGGNITIKSPGQNTNAKVD